MFLLAWFECRFVIWFVFDDKATCFVSNGRDEFLNKNLRLYVLKEY